jgi:putative two-component system response regulator
MTSIPVLSAAATLPAARRPKVLVVDDVPANRALLAGHLARLSCQVIEASDGPSALAALNGDLDLVLLDIQMPGMDGFEVCRRIKQDPRTRLLPVVMVTALNALDDRVQALEAGSDDFLSKPVERLELQARVSSLLRLKSALDRLDDADRVIFALARAVEAKDLHTEAHTQRVAAHAVALGTRLGLSHDDLAQLQRGALTHDIGKIGIPDAILLKPAALTEEEAAIMRTHPLIGLSIASGLHSAAAFLSVIRHHHEHFDGTGYPDQLSGDQIPLLARITAISDAYDALTSARPYRAARSPQDAIAILQAGSGSQWDPSLVNIFVEQVLALPDPSPAGGD